MTSAGFSFAGKLYNVGVTEVQNMDVSKLSRSKTPSLLTAALLLYVAAAGIIVGSAWATGLYPFDLKLTVSLYVGLRGWTALLFCVVNVCVAVLVLLYFRGLKFNFLQRAANCITFVFLVGLSVFPTLMGQPEALSSRGHAFFSPAYFIAEVVCFVLNIVFDKEAGHKLYSLAGALYGAAFIVCRIRGFAFFTDYIFIWENIFIFVYIFGLYLPKSRDFHAASKT